MTGNPAPALAFWRQAAANSLPARYVLGEVMAIQNRYRMDDPVEFEAMRVEVDRLLGELGYETDLESISTARGATDNDLGCWAGSYTLFDPAGKSYRLEVDTEKTTLTLPADAAAPSADPVAARSEILLSHTTFADGKLSMSSDRFSAELRFTHPYPADHLSDVDVEEPFARGLNPLCGGRVVGPAGAVPVTGKRGSHTPQGVGNSLDGDPMSTWLGEYRLLDCTEEEWTWAGEPIVLTGDGKQMSFTWGKCYGTSRRFQQNVLLSTVETLRDCDLAIEFEMSTRGQPQLHAVLQEKGHTRRFLGFWTGIPVTPQPARLRALTMAVAKDFDFDLAAMKDGATVDLPDTVPGGAYQLPLRLLNFSDFGSGPITWRLEPAGTLAITPGAERGKAALAGVFAGTDVGAHEFTLTLTTSTRSRRLLLRLRVLTPPPIGVSPAVLPPIVRGVQYSMTLGASGGRAPFTWEQLAGSTLPDGITFDPDGPTLSGKVSAGESQHVYALKVRVTPAESLRMDPVTTVLSITVVEPAAVAKVEVDWSLLALGALSSLFAITTGVKNVYDFFKARERNAGDPTLKKKYNWASRMGIALTAGIQGTIGENYAHFIEQAVRFDVEHPNRLIEIGQAKASALQWYDRLLNHYGERIEALKRDLASARGEDKRKKIERDLAKERAGATETFREAHRAVVEAEHATRSERERARHEPNAERARNHHGS